MKRCENCVRLFVKMALKWAQLISMDESSALRNFLCLLISFEISPLRKEMFSRNGLTYFQWKYKFTKNWNNLEYEIDFHSKPLAKLLHAKGIQYTITMLVWYETFFIIIQWAVELPFFPPHCVSSVHTHIQAHGNNKPPERMGKDVSEDVYRTQKKKKGKNWAYVGRMWNYFKWFCLPYVPCVYKCTFEDLTLSLKHFKSRKIVCSPPQLDFAMAWSDGKLCIATYMRNVLFVGNK